jgi:hypothetical protein
MPFEAIPKILGDSNNKNPAPKNPLASSGNLNSGKFKILKKDDFKTFSKINANGINDEFLGFFSLLASYSVLAHTSTAKEGPKRIVPIMPRTNFVTQYTTFVESKLKAQLDGGQTTLYDIIEKVTGSDAKLAKETFTWTGKKAGAVVTPTGDTWNGKDADAEAGTLEVQKFLDYIQGWDRVAKKALSKSWILWSSWIRCCDTARLEVSAPSWNRSIKEPSTCPSSSFATLIKSREVTSELLWKPMKTRLSRTTLVRHERNIDILEEGKVLVLVPEALTRWRFS